MDFSYLRVWSHLLKKSLTESSFFVQWYIFMALEGNTVILQYKKQRARAVNFSFIARKQHLNLELLYITKIAFSFVRLPMVDKKKNLIMLSLMGCIQQAMSCLKLTLQKQSPSGVLRNIAKFTRKHLLQSLIYNKVADSGTGVFM